MTRTPEGITASAKPSRPNTLLNELRALLVNYTPQQRLDMFEMIEDGWCVKTGERVETCTCARHEGR